MKEFWELVTADGNSSGILYDRNCGEPIPDGMFFKVSEVFVKVGNRLLITQRHPDKWAGLMWEASGGGVLAGETTRQSAARELFEETGISTSPDRLIYLGRTTHKAAMVESFLLVLKEKPTLALQPTEVVDAKFVTRRQLIAMEAELTPDTVKRCKLFSRKIFPRFGMSKSPRKKSE